jgi:hypothetical protein
MSAAEPFANEASGELVRLARGRANRRPKPAAAIAQGSRHGQRPNT